MKRPVALAALRWLALVPVLAFAACTVGPNYVPPATPVAEVWEETAAAAEQHDPALSTWWTAFGDPVLEELIARAGRANPGLRAAAARIEEARALLGVAGGRLAPDVALDGAASRSRRSDNGAVAPPPGGFEPSDLFSVSLGASWEIDLFGRLRRGVESAAASLDASVEDYRDVLVVLYADVGATYAELRTLQTRLAYAEANVAAQRQTAKLTSDRFQAGLTSKRDVTQAEANLAATESALPALEAAIDATLHRLAILVGVLPGSLHEELSAATPLHEPAVELTASLPVELLRRRPDVRRSERLLAAQTARIGVAKADLYPSFSLVGSVGLEATDAGDLGESSSRTWVVIPGLRWNLFSGGKIRDLVRAEEARAAQALALYEGTVLRALAEVESALTALAGERERRDRLVQAVASTERTVELVNTQYKSGLTDFQSYLDAQRSLFELQDRLAQSQGQVIANLIGLERALGGGWDAADGVERLPAETATAAMAGTSESED